MLLLTLLSLHLFENAIQASPIPDHLADFSLVSRSSCNCPDSGGQRSTLDIIWSCLATMFACTWVAVHPNIPSAEENWWMVARRRIKLMFWAIIAPEMIIFWAMRQWFHARRIAEKFKDRNWTAVHGFLLQMGGFILYDEDERQEPISFTKLQSLFEAGLIDFPNITVEEIKDRSKGDLLAKGIVTAQTSWFIVQCIARGIQGLVITELELVTVAFAVLNGVMYFFWWDKPLDVRCSIPVYLKKPKTRSHSLDEGLDLEKLQVETVLRSVDDSYMNLDLQDSETAVFPLSHAHSLQHIQDSDQQLEREIDTLNGAAPTDCKPEKTDENADIDATESAQERQNHEWVSGVDTDANHSRWTACFHKIWDAIWYVLVVRLIVDILRPLDDMTQSPTSITIEHGVTRVPTFYAAPSPPKILYGLNMPSSIIALAFGAIHCIGWSSGFLFPTHTEKILWRTCSLTVTCVPVPFLVLAILLYKKVHWRPPGIGRSLFHLFKRLIYISLVLYIIARLSLLIQAFVALRSLPEGAHRTVEWITFFPHL